MNFSDALRLVKEGRRVRRALWEERSYAYNAWLELVSVRAQDGRGVMPVLMVGYPGENGILRPFSGANWDLLADDWELAE